MPKILWVVVKTNNQKEAVKIGRAVLRRRLAVCFDVLPRLRGEYFWPPGKNLVQASRGPNLILETLPLALKELKKLIKQLHSDQLPFIGIIKLDVERNFYDWIKQELK